MTYTLGDFIIRLKNASLARRRKVVLPFSRLIKAVGMVLQKEGLLAEVKEDISDGRKVLIATLRYVRRKPVIGGVKIISRPSMRSYIGADELKQKLRGPSIKILSTNQGILTGKEAKSQKVGGELLFEVW